MTKTISRLFAVALAILALTGAGNAFAGPATDVVKTKQASLFELLRQPTPDRQKIGAIFDEMFDYPSSRRVPSAASGRRVPTPKRLTSRRS